MRRRVSRRGVLRFYGAGVTAAAAGGTAGILAAGHAPACAQQTTLHRLRWDAPDKSVNGHTTSR
jgi:hypothetical protein